MGNCLIAQFVRFGDVVIKVHSRDLVVVLKIFSFFSA